VVTGLTSTFIIALVFIAIVVAAFIVTRIKPSSESTKHRGLTYE
jgi:hypothetical protein